MSQSCTPTALIEEEAKGQMRAKQSNPGAKMMQVNVCANSVLSERKNDQRVETDQIWGKWLKPIEVSQDGFLRV